MTAQPVIGPRVLVVRKRRVVAPVLRISIALLATLSGIGCSPAPTSDRPSFVLIISDDHDYTHLGFLGLNPVVETPEIDKIAAAGTVFPVAYATPRCRSTLAGLLTGLPSHLNGIHANVVEPALDRRLSLPSLLSRAGYATFAQGKFWEGSVRDYGFTHGPGLDYGLGRAPRDQVDRFLDDVGHDPFFLWWAPMLPHLPHAPPKRLRAKFSSANLEVPKHIAPADTEDWRKKEAELLSMVSWLDEGVGELMRQLERHGRLENTIVIFLADNGWAVGAPGKGSVFEKGLRTSIAFSGPGILQASHPEQLVSHLDIMPTVLDYAGLPSPEATIGRSLRPLLEGREQAAREYLVGAVYPRIAEAGPLADAYALYVRTQRFKYVHYLKTLRDTPELKIVHVLLPFPGRRAGEENLYDLELDPLEQVDLSGLPVQRERLDRLRSIALTWWEDASNQGRRGSK